MRISLAARPAEGWPILALLAAVGAGIGGCSGARGTAHQDSPAPIEEQSSRVDVYLGRADRGARSVVFDLEALELRSATGETRALELQRRRIDSRQLAQRVPLAGAIVPPDDYAALVLRIARAELAGPGGSIPLRLAPAAEGRPAEPAVPADSTEPRNYELPLRAHLGRRDALSLFLDWHVDESLAGGADFAPRFALATERPRVALGLLYVADEASSAVLAVDRSSGEVVDTFKVGARPRALAIARDARRLFVANSGDGSLQLVDVRQGGVLATLSFGLSAGTRDVVLDERSRLLALAQTGLDRVSLVESNEVVRGQEASVGREPVRLALVPELRKLFVCESSADAVEVLDLGSATVVARLPVESRPTDVAVDRRGLELFVAHRTSPNLLVFDTRTLALVSTIHVGADVTAVLADRRRDRIYLARARPAEIAVVDRALANVVRRIPVSGRIESLAQTLDGGELYGAASELGALIVVDVVLGKERDPIRCGGRPMDVVLAE